MKQYPVKNIRNVALLGHGGDGKTTLAEAMLYFSGAIDRFGKIVDGTTAGDYDSEEIKRQISISTSLLPVEWKDYKINILDTPGFFDFEGEVKSALRVVDGVLICVTGKDGVQVGTEKAWKYCKDAKKAKMFVITKVDEENSDFYRVIEQLHNKFGHSICPIMLPIFENEKMCGYVNLITNTAKKYTSGKPEEIPMPESMKAKIEASQQMIYEAVAETSEENMEKYFAGEAFTEEEIVAAIKIGVAESTITPVMITSAVEMTGVENVLKTIKNFFPSPDEMPVDGCTDMDGNPITILRDPAGPVSAIVFKTVNDQFGKMSYFKVVSGELKSDMTLVNTRTGNTEKLGRLYYARGKKNVETPAVGVGDIAFVKKLESTVTGDTLCASERKVHLAGINYPSANYGMAIIVKNKTDEEKVSIGLKELAAADPTLRYFHNHETHQRILYGLGDTQLDVAISKMKAKYNVDVDLEEPIVPYREMIKKKVKVQGRHKKQSGGSGQFGDVWIEFEPGVTEELTFETNIFGGSVPKNYFPAVEKGLQESVLKGTLAGYPVVNLKATLVDGSYHPVDSNEISFKLAAKLAYKAAMPQANPVLLEPVGTLEVSVPESYTGDIMGDINKRRGRVLGMEPVGEGVTVIVAEVPIAEMASYAINLRSMTSGRGSYVFEFVRYEEAPANISQKVIAESKHRLEEDA